MEMNNTPVDGIPNMNGGIRPPWVVEEADPLVSTYWISDIMVNGLQVGFRSDRCVGHFT
jgi:hypothetical protein